MRALAVGAFAFRTNGRMWVTRVGLAGGLAILLLGPVLSATSGRGWTFDGDLGFYGFLVAALFGLRSGLEEQRETGLAGFLQHNLVPPLGHAAGMLLALLAGWAALTAGAFLAVLVAGGGDAATAAWHAAGWGLRVLGLLGFVPLVERFSTLRIPFILPALVYLALLVTLTLVIGETAAVALFLPVRRSEPDTLLRLAAQSALLFGAGAALFLLTAALSARRAHR